MQMTADFSGRVITDYDQLAVIWTRVSTTIPAVVIRRRRRRECADHENVDPSSSHRRRSYLSVA